MSERNPQKTKPETTHQPSTEVLATRDVTSVVFECSACGECCSTVNIPIVKEKVVFLRSRPWVNDLLSQHQLDFIHYDDTHDLLPLNDEAYCVFLGEDKRCQIHVIEGESRKPIECMRFPFGATAMSNGRIRFDVSASCKQVSESLLGHIAPIVPKNTASVPLNDATFPKQIPVRRRFFFFNHSVDEPTYQHYLDTIEQIFQSPIPPEAALKQVAHLLRGLKSSSPQQPFVPIKSSFQFWNLWPTLFLTQLLRRPYGMINQWAILSEGNYSDPKLFGLTPIALKGHKHITWGSTPEETTALNTQLNGFLLNILRRHLPLAFGHRLETLLLIATCGYFIAQWYARTLALLNPSANNVTLQALALALRLTERYYTGHQPAFLEAFRLFPLTPLFLRLLFNYR